MLICRMFSCIVEHFYCMKMMEPVSETFHRRPNKDSSNGIPRSTVNAAFSEHVSTKTPNPVATARNNMLLLAIAIPFLILLVFGGRVSLLIVCFGGLICYIFDLIGSVEVTFIAIVMTLLGLLGSLIWAARVVVEENLFNFSIVIMMGLLLFQLGSIMASYFNVVLSELGTLFEVIDPLVFATLPLVSSSLISWFLCVEIPALDLESTFTCIYFLYVLCVLNPRFKGGRDVLMKHQVSSVMISVGSSPTQPVVPRFVMFAVYTIPILMSMAIHAALHHNVLSTSKTRLIGFAMSFLFPSFLMIVCAKRQIGYWEPHLRPAVSTKLNWLTVLVGAVMMLCLQDHPFLDEIKSFSGFEEPWDSYLLLGVMISVGYASWMHQYIGSVKAASDEIDSISATGHQQARVSEFINVLESLVSLSIGVSAALLSLLVNIPFKVLPVSMIGAMAVAEYYQRPSWGVLNKVLLIVIGAISLAIVAVAFTHHTLFYLLFGFSWHIDLTMQQFCAHFAILCASSVVIPAIVRPTGDGKTKVDFADLLPGGGGGGGHNKFGIFRGVYKKLFGYCMIFLTFVMAGAELMLREQDWSGLEVTVETIFPTSYLIGVTIIVALTTAGLYSAKIIGPATTWILMVIQGCKLLHLIGMPSMACATTAAILLTYTLPFIRHIHQYIRLTNELESSTQETNANGTLKIRTLNAFEVSFYAATAFMATYLARYHVAYTALSTLMSNDPSDLQLTTACAAMYSLYLSCLLLVFLKKARVFRSILLVVSLLCTLVATEGLGKLSFALDPTSPTYLTVALHPDMAVNEHTGLFILLSGALSLMAFVGLIPLQNQVVGLIYAIVFSYCSTKATLGWAFPLSLADDLLTHDMFAFPFVYIYTSKFLNCFVALRHTDSNPLITDVMFGIICCMPFAAVVYSYFMNIYDVAIKGIVWSAIISTSSLCITVRACEFVSDIKLLSRGASVTGNSSTSVINRAGRAQVAHKVMLICVMSSVLCVFWTSVSIALDSHLDRDLLVPLAILLFMTTKKSTLLPEVYPLAIVAMLFTIWWVLSALHAMFVRGFRVDVFASGAVAGEFHYQQHSIFGLDSDVSIWTSGSEWYYHLLHLVLLLLPLPGIVLSFLKNKSDSEDVLFALALCSAISIVGGPVGSIRYLGLLGGIYAGWRCYDIGHTKKISDRLI